MNLSGAVSTSPRAVGTPKKNGGSGGVDNFGKVSLVNVKGGQEKYSGQKSDMNLPQHGGEGGGKEGKVPSGSDDNLLLKNPDTKYGGPGRFLKTE